MRRRLLAALSASVLLLGVAVVAVVPTPAVAGGPCPPGEVEVRGIVRDAATMAPLQEVTSVEYEPFGSGTPADGEATDPATSRYSVCLLPDTYQFTFRADSYRLDQAAGLEVEVVQPGPIVRNVALTPRGKVLAGRVTNMHGAPRFASIGIWRLTSRGWRSIDGEGNDERTGVWSYRVPRVGRYRVSACVDNHWCQWATSADRRSDARILVVRRNTQFISDVNVRVPFCRSSPPDFCVPWGFNT